MSFESIHDLLGTPGLQSYLSTFVAEGFDSLDFIMDMQPSGWDTMLDIVADALEAQGKALKGGHAMQILSRLRAEKARRKDAKASTAAATTQVAELRRQQSRRARNLLIGDDGNVIQDQHAPAGRANGGAIPQELDVNGYPISPREQRRRTRERERTRRRIERAEARQATKAARQVKTKAPPAPNALVGFQRNGDPLQPHWIVCFAVFVLLVIISFILIVLHGEFSDTSSDGGTTDSSRDGGWDFTQVFAAIGFFFAGIALLCSFYCCCRDPEQASPLKQLFGCGGDEPGCCDDCDCGDCCQCEGLQECCKDCDCGACSNCTLPKCSCPTGLIPACNCDEFMGDCPECECEAPRLDCSCCPDCQNAGECAGKCWKIMCCRCQIQV